ncbi:MAG: hypothetical protein H6917_16900 [Novosphingobium sp.]|nr:hypothetical protein [Novosphingobium sp.]MCP5404053.1 hypothetical protein [Novosphingobium sp.]
MRLFTFSKRASANFYSTAGKFLSMVGIQQSRRVSSTDPMVESEAAPSEAAYTPDGKPDSSVARMHGYIEERLSGESGTSRFSPADEGDLDEKVDAAVSGFSKYAGIALFLAVLAGVIYLIVA